MSSKVLKKSETNTIIEIKPTYGDKMVFEFNYKDNLAMYIHTMFWNIKDESTTLNFDKNKLGKLLEILNDYIKKGDEIKDKYFLNINGKYENQLCISFNGLLNLSLNEKYCFNETTPRCQFDKEGMQRLYKLLKSAYDKFEI